MMHDHTRPKSRTLDKIAHRLWYPTNALSNDNLLSEQKGLTFRVFERLFARIKDVGLEVLVLTTLEVTHYLSFCLKLQEEVKYADKLLKY